MDASTTTIQISGLGWVVLIVIVAFFVFLFVKSKGAYPNVDTGETEAPREDIAAVELPVAEEELPLADNGQLVAVIAAALMAYQEEGKTLVVRAVRRVQTRSAWADAARREQMR